MENLEKILEKIDNKDVNLKYVEKVIDNSITFLHIRNQEKYKVRGTQNIIIVIEEISEFIKEFMDYRYFGKVNKLNFLEEFSDLIYCLFYIKSIYNISDFENDEFIYFSDEEIIKELLNLQKILTKTLRGKDLSDELKVSTKMLSAIIAYIYQFDIIDVNTIKKILYAKALKMDKLISEGKLK